MLIDENGKPKQALERPGIGAKLQANLGSTINGVKKNPGKHLLKSPKWAKLSNENESSTHQCKHGESKNLTAQISVKFRANTMAEAEIRVSAIPPAKKPSLKLNKPVNIFSRTASVGGVDALTSNHETIGSGRL